MMKKTKENKKIRNKKEEVKGITLIALVVTIICGNSKYEKCWYN